MTYLERIGRHLGLGGRPHRMSSDLGRWPQLPAPCKEPPPEPSDEQTNDTLPMIHLDDAESQDRAAPT
jgi:hypothetical protein